MMNTQYKQLMIEMWQAACMDRPLRPSARVEDGHFVMTVTGNREKWVELLAAAGVPSTASEEVDETAQRLTVRWPSLADSIFGDGGLLAQHLPGYEMRLAQVQMGRLVQRSIEMNCPALAEAGTGTGKSFAYSAVTLAMNKRVIIAAPTTALQMQLFKKDVPFLVSLPPYQGKKVVFAMGKSRYVCRHKAEDRLTGSLSIDNPDFAVWYATTETGNLEETTFAMTGDERHRVNVDDDCLGKQCPLYDTCFYYKAKAERAQADVVITNHSLLALHTALEGAGILPPVDVVVVDEAHQLPDYVRNALGIEFTRIGIDNVVARAVKLGADEDLVDACTEHTDLFALEIARFVADLSTSDYSSEIGVRCERTFPAGLELAARLRSLATDLWNPSEMPQGRDEIRKAQGARAVRSMADHVQVFSERTAEGSVRMVKRDTRSGKLTYCSVPYDVSEFIASMCGVHQQATTLLDHTRCTRCHRKLTAPKLALLNGLPYGPDCIQEVDALGDAEVVDLADWLAQEHPKAKTVTSAADRPVIFTSATLAAPDMAAIRREFGLTDTLDMQVQSPFDYNRNALVFVPDAGAPVPANGARDEHTRYAIETMEKLVLASGGGAFLLFTSYSSMKWAASELIDTFERRGITCFMQGDLPKMELIARFKQHGNGVLFATKSFWEGVDVQGAALRLVVIDKLPFEAPNPLNQAQEDALRRYAEKELGYTGNKLQWYPFEALRVPKMIIDLKQGAGRLIRTRADQGVIAILDPRVRKTQYGRNCVLPSLPPAPLTSNLNDAARFLEGVCNAQLA